MARWWWLKKWREDRVKRHVHKTFETEVLRPLAAFSRANAALRHNSKHRAGSLYLLPEDLLFIICQYLTSAEATALMLSCTRFWRSKTGTGVFARIWQQMKAPVGKDLSKMAARFYVLRMLEYDGLLQKGPQKKYCCWGCMTAHERSSFPSMEFEKAVDLKSKQDSYPKETTTRSCLLSKRYIWFGICREMSFVEFRHAVINPHTQRQVNGWIYLPDNPRFVFRDCSLLDGNSRRLEYMFELGRSNHFRSNASFKRHARDVNIPLCPHIRLGDRGVIQLYRQPTKVLRCRYCSTTVRMTGTSIIKVYVFRHVGLLRSPTDREWMAQSHQRRHPRLEVHCRAFGHWYKRLYGENGIVANGGGFKRLGYGMSGWMFKGTSSCTPKWPGGHPRLLNL